MVAEVVAVDVIVVVCVIVAVEVMEVVAVVVAVEVTLDVAVVDLEEVKDVVGVVVMVVVGLVVDDVLCEVVKVTTGLQLRLYRLNLLLSEHTAKSENLLSVVVKTLSSVKSLRCTISPRPTKLCATLF